MQNSESRTIKCRINGHNLRLKTQSKVMQGKRGKWNKNSHREVEAQKGNIWPWRFMLPGECVVVPYKVASYNQMRNSMNGYARHSIGARFFCRSEALGLAVWRVE